MERTVDLPTPLGSKPCESQQIIRSIGPLGQCPQVPINQDARASLCSSQGAAEFPQLNGPHWRSAATSLVALWGNQDAHSAPRQQNRERAVFRTVERVSGPYPEGQGGIYKLSSRAERRHQCSNWESPSDRWNRYGSKVGGDSLERR